MSESIGKFLIKARKERGLTLEEVSTATHIKLHYLKAIEADQREVLPSEAQYRGFLRLYAGYLNLPTELLLKPESEKASTPPEDFQPTVNKAGKPLSPTPGTSTREPPSAIPQVPPASAPGVEPPETSEALSAAKPLPSQEIFQQLGSTLRSRRDALELMLQDIEHHLHVRSDYLQALEFGRIDLLPSPVQGRGMLSNYASFLDLDVDTILLKFADGLQAQRDERLALEPPRQIISRLRSRHLSTLRQFLTADLMVGAAALIFLLVFAVWSTAQVITIRLDQSPDVDYNIAAPYQTSTAALELGEPAPSLPPPSETAQENVDTQPPQLDQTGNPEQPQTMTVEPPPATNNAPLQILILARQRVWLRVTTDNRVVFEGRVTPGTGYPFSANQKIELLTGNAAALQVTFNQQNLGILGSPGEVVSLVFTASGVVTPTPRFSPTPTTTLTPTYTPAPTQTPPPTPTVPTPTITPHIP